jgi:dynein heavy chain
MEGNEGLRVMHLTDANFLRTLENRIRIGSPVLIEDVGENLDSVLDPLLMNQTFKQGGRLIVRLGDVDVDYEPSFRLYMTTKLANPHFLPEIFIKTNVINCTVTIQGLEDQLLGAVVVKEQPELEQKRNSLITRIANDRRQMRDLEERILKLLYQAEGNILDDEVLINTLKDSKATANVVQVRVKEAEETEKNISIF